MSVNNVSVCFVAFPQRLSQATFDTVRCLFHLFESFRRFETNPSLGWNDHLFVGMRIGTVSFLGHVGIKGSKALQTNGTTISDRFNDRIEDGVQDSFRNGLGQFISAGDFFCNRRLGHWFLIICGCCRCSEVGHLALALFQTTGTGSATGGGSVGTAEWKEGRKRLSRHMTADLLEHG